MSAKKNMLVVLAAICLMAMAFAAPPQNDTVNISLLIKEAPNVTVTELNDATLGDGQITLAANDNVTVNCTGNIEDLDGIVDLNTSSFAAVIYYQAKTGLQTGIKYEQNFIWTDCTNTTVDENNTNVVCSYEAPFFTENGTWQCNMSISDNDGLSGTGNNTSVVQDLIALNITKETIDFGNLAPGQNKNGDEYNFTIQNIGNVPLDFEFNAYAETQFDAKAMNCTTGLMSENSLRYSLISGEAFVDQNALNNLASVDLVDANLAEQNNATTAATRDVFWGVEVFTLDGVSGSCNGYIFVNAIQG